MPLSRSNATTERPGAWPASTALSSRAWNLALRSDMVTDRAALGGASSQGELRELVRTRPPRCEATVATWAESTGATERGQYSQGDVGGQVASARMIRRRRRSNSQDACTAALACVSLASSPRGSNSLAAGPRAKRADRHGHSESAVRCECVVDEEWNRANERRAGREQRQCLTSSIGSTRRLGQSVASSFATSTSPMSALRRVSGFTVVQTGILSPRTT